MNTNLPAMQHPVTHSVMERIQKDFKDYVDDVPGVLFVNEDRGYRVNLTDGEVRPVSLLYDQEESNRSFFQGILIKFSEEDYFEIHMKHPEWFKPSPATLFNMDNVFDRDCYFPENLDYYILPVYSSDNIVGFEEFSEKKRDFVFFLANQMNQPDCSGNINITSNFDES